MTVKPRALAGASSTDATAWQAIDWSVAVQSVRRLQLRITKAAQAGRHNKVKALQWLLTHGFYAKALAVKSVTENRGARTAGVDGRVCQTPTQKMRLARSLTRRGYRPQPLRRVDIPKRSDPTARRPLSIPTIKDRAMQSLYRFALLPMAELKADPNAYGFRPKRCVADAIEQCFRALSQKASAQYVLEGDIEKCFDQISHDWLLTQIPMDKRILAGWLKAGYMKANTWYPTTAGTSQGGTGSPTLAVMALSGLEQAVQAVVKPRDKVHVIAYADDFVVTGASQEILAQTVKPAIESFLATRGLRLSAKKTHITHIDRGFVFLGHQIRKYQGKLLIKPSRASMQNFLAGVREIIHRHRGHKTITLINHLNPRIRGWANYYRHVVSKQIFAKLDDSIYRALAHWVKRRHPNKNATWWRKHYFRQQGARQWVFSARHAKDLTRRVDVFRMAHMPIRRHVKIKACANPFDSHWLSYFRARNIAKLQERAYLKQRLNKLMGVPRGAGKANRRAAGSA